MVSVREVNAAALTLKVRVDDVAVAYPAFAAIDASIEQSPAATQATTPVEEFTVQTDVVELE